MPKYVVTDSVTGQKLILTGDSPPTEQELSDIFANYQQPPTEDKYANDSAWDFSGERTLFGRALEMNKAVPRGGISTALTALQGAEGMSKYQPGAIIGEYLGKKALGLFGVDEAEIEAKRAEQREIFPKMQRYIQEDSILAADEKYRDLWTTQFGEGAGSFGTFALTTLINPGLGVATGVATGAGTQAEKVRQAREEGKEVSDFQEFAATTLGAGIGALEAYTPFKLVKALKSVPKNIPLSAKEKLFSLASQVFNPSVIKTGVGEGGQEVVSSILQQIVEMGYNPDAELPSGESLWNDFSIGAVTGAGADIVTNAVKARRLNAINQIDSERERDFRQAEDANNFLWGQMLRDNEQARLLAERDPDEFRRQAMAARTKAAEVALPSVEEVSQFTAPSYGKKEPTPAAVGELYSMRIIGALGRFFPTDTSFSVQQADDGFRVTDAEGMQYGQPLQDQRAAVSLAANLNKEVGNKGIRGSILETLMSAPQGYSQKDADALFRYGYRTLSPDANRVSFAALNEAAGTTTEKGYVEDLPPDILAGAKKLRDGRYSVQMPDGSTRYIAGLTASQKLNMKRLEQGLPAATTFSISEARDFLGDKIGALAEPGISGIQDNAEYGGMVLDGKPVVATSAGEILTGRIVPEAERIRAGKDEDGNDILPDFLEFKTLDEAKRYAGRLNQRGAGSRFLPAEITRGKDDLTDDIKRLLKAKNITSETGSPEINQLVRAFTGAKKFSDMSLDDQKLFYARMRELPSLSEPAKIPEFKPRPFSAEQFVRAVKAENDAGRPLAADEIAAAAGVEKGSPAVAAIRSELDRQNKGRETQARREAEEAEPLRAALSKVLEAFKLDPAILKVKTKLTDEEGNLIEDEGYYDARLNELAIAIDAIDPEGTKTEEQRIQALKGVLTHEALHVLRSLDLFTQKEWALLEAAAARTKRKTKEGEEARDETYLQRARRLYPDKSPVIQMEEAVAELSRDFISDKTVIGGKPRNLIERIIKFFTKLRNLMDGYGFTSFQDVLTAMETGQIGGRERGQVRSLRLTEEMNAKQLGIVPARYKPFIDEFRGAAELGREPAGAVPGEEVAAGRLPTEAAPGPDADFDIRPTGAGMRQSRRYSVKDIEKLTDSRGSLKTFAQQFGDRIKQSDRTLADADRIAKDYIKEFVENPSAFLPVVTGDKLNAETFLRMPDGTMYDPNKLEHADATDQTIRIYNAVQDGTVGKLLQQEAQSLNQQRAEDLSNLSAYLNENADYSLAEQALIMNGASKYGVRFDKKRGFILVPITGDNRTSVAVVTAIEASAIAEELRKGKTLKDAMLSGIGNAIDTKKKENKADKLNGWKTFKKSDSEEDAAALKDGCAGREWCTASATSTARSQLSQGDFHVYYKNGEPIVALRTVDGKLAEPPRGSLPQQFMTAEEEKIAEEALRAGRADGGEDYLHDRELIADVIAGRHKNWPDLDLFVKTERKYPVGYGKDKFKLPAPVVNAINEEKNRRHSEKEWFALGYTTGDVTISEADGADFKYIGGNLIINGLSTPENSFSSQFSEKISLIAKNILNRNQKIKVDYVKGGVIDNEKSKYSSFVNQEINIGFVGQNASFRNGKATIGTVVNSLYVYDDASVDFKKAKNLSMAGKNSKAFGGIVEEMLNQMGNSFAKIKSANRVIAQENTTCIIDDVNDATVVGNATLKANKAHGRIVARDDGSKVYISSMEDKSEIDANYGSEVFIKNLKAGSNFNATGSLRSFGYGSPKFFIKKSNVDILINYSNKQVSDGFAYKSSPTLVVETLDASSLSLGQEAKAYIKDAGNTSIFANDNANVIVGRSDMYPFGGENIENTENMDNVWPPELAKQFNEGMAVIEQEFPETVGRRYSRKDVKSSKDWAYSPLMKAVESVSPKVTTAKQWDQWLDANAPKLGVTKDEIEFSGIKDFIALKEGKVSKDDVLSYLDENGVVVKDVMSPTGESIGKGADFTLWQPEEDSTLGTGKEYKEILMTIPETARKPFQSGHWEQPNVVSHTRFRTQKDIDGNPVMVVFEIQSDWGQRGREEGFSRTEPYNKYHVLVDNELVATFDTKEDAEKAIEDAKKYTKDVDIKIKEVLNKKEFIGVPAGPFVKETKSWVALTLKRLLRYAVDNGFKKIAIANGTQVAELYRLSKRVSSIHAERNRYGTYLITAKDKNGIEIDNFIANNQSEIAGYIGKDLAEKIVNDIDAEESSPVDTSKLEAMQNEDFETYGVYTSDLEKVGPSFETIDDAREYLYKLRDGELKVPSVRKKVKYSGLELDIGGEGMKAFYNKIVPQVAKEVVRQVGGDGSVRTTQLAPMDAEKLYRVDFQPGFEGGSYQLRQAGSHTRIGRFKTPADAWAEAERLTTMTPRPEQLSIEITPEMERNILAGQRLFSRKDLPATIEVDGVQRPTVNSKGQQIHNTEDGVRNFWRWFGNSEVVDEQGRPLVVYHGTTADINEFDLSRAGQKDSGWYGIGFYSTIDPETASAYSVYDEMKDGSPTVGANVLPVYVALKNPYFWPSNRQAGRNRAESDAITKELIEQGFDGVIVSNQYQAPEYAKFYEIVSFRPEQIKSAIANTGAFSPESSDIRYSRKDTGQPEVRNPNLVQRSPEVLQEAVQKVEKSVADTGRYSVPLYNPKASPEALYVALNPDSGEKLDTEERRRYSRRNAPEYDPKAKAIMDRVIPQPPDETTGEFYINKMKGFDAKAALDRARANLFFQHARLERQYRENPELAKMLADTSALAMVQMADHAHQFIMSALTIGVPVYRNGMFTTDDFVHNGKKYKGLIEVMSLLRTPDGKNFEQLAHAYATAVRGERLNKEGKLTPVNPGELKVLEDEVNRFINPETGKPIVKEWFDAWQAYNSHVVKYLRDTGIVDDEGAALWLKQADYVPFYREDKNGKLLHPRVFGGMHTAGQFKAVGTSDEALNIDMLTAIQNNLNAAIAMGMRNVAQQRVVRDQINLGLGRMLNPGEEVGDRTTVSFKRKGKKQTAIIDDPLIYQAMLPISEIPMDNILGQAFRKPAELLRSFIVHDPAYMIANSMRDSISSYVITGAEIVPGVSTVKNLAADLDKLKRLGIVGNYNLLFDKDQVRKFYAKEARKMGKFLNEDWTRPWEALWDILGRMNQQIDAATRVAVYEDVLKRTGNEAEAQYQALSVMNYGRRGANPFVRYITAISPFLNTRFQGLDKLYQAKAGRVGAMYKKDASGKVIREADWRKNAMRFYSRAGLITGLSVLYWVMVSDDDEYKNATPESRDNYYIIPIEKGDIETGKPGLSFRIPIPFEIGLLFKVVPERILETMFGDDTPKDLKDSFWRNLKSTLAVNWPQTILPLIEWRQNKDSYSGRPIVPTYMLNLPPEEQKNFYTNRGAVWLGEKLGMSPMKIEALGYGYGGTIGGYILQAVDSAMRSGAEEKPGLAWHQYPVIKRFFATANQPGLQAQFYDLKDSVDGITKTVNELSEQGKYDELATFYAKNGHMYDMRSDINFLNRQITKLRDERKMVEQMDIPPESKRILIEQINMQIAAELTTVPMLRKQAFGPKPEIEE